jgi:hypothetical protein
LAPPDRSSAAFEISLSAITSALTLNSPRSIDCETLSTLAALKSASPDDSSAVAVLEARPERWLRRVAASRRPQGLQSTVRRWTTALQLASRWACQPDFRFS